MSLDVDAIYGEIGELGRQQMRFCAALCLLNVYGAWHMLQYTFVGYTMPFTCVVDDKEDSLYHGECLLGLSSRCVKITFSTVQEETTIVSEWGLVCDRAWLGPLTMSAFMGGVMSGALVLGAAADAIGRKRTLAACLTGMMLSDGMAAIVGDFIVYTTLRFVDGFFVGGYVLTSFVLCNELIGSSKRGFVGTGIQAFFAAGIVLLSVTASCIRHWRHLTILTSLLGVPLLPLVMCYLPESPRWLLSKGRLREALVVLRTIADRNGRALSEKSVLGADTSTRDDDGVVIVNPGSSKPGGICDLFRHRILFELTAIQIYSWFVNSAAYYGLTLAAGESSGNRYLSTALSGAIELPAYAITVFLLAQTGRRWALAGFMLSGGVSLLCILLTAWSVSAVRWQALFCKLCIAASFAVVYIHSSEIFPTEIRNTAMGVVSVAARAGGVVAPFLAQLGSVSPNLHFFVFGGLMFSAGLLNLRLPETQGLSLPETVQELLKRSYDQRRGGINKRSSARYEKLMTEEVLEEDIEDT